MTKPTKRFVNMRVNVHANGYTLNFNDENRMTQPIYVAKTLDEVRVLMGDLLMDAPVNVLEDRSNLPF